MHQRDHHQNCQCDHGSSLTVGLQATHDVLTCIVDSVSTAGQTEVTGHGGTGHHTEHGNSGVAVAGTGQNQLTQGAAAQQHRAPANDYHAQEVPQVCAVGNGLALEAQLEGAGSQIANEGDHKDGDEAVQQLAADCDIDVANYNCPGQVVISGTTEGVKAACEALKAAGAKRALPLAVSGGFHSPCMASAREELKAAIEATEFFVPRCPIYQNVDALPHTDPEDIKANLIAQLTSPVRWTQSVRAMLRDGAVEFVECGPGAVLTGLIAKIKA